MKEGHRKILVRNFGMAPGDRGAAQRFLSGEKDPEAGLG